MATVYENGAVPTAGLDQVNVTVCGPTPMFWPFVGEIRVAGPGATQSATLNGTGSTTALTGVPPPVGLACAVAKDAMYPKPTGKPPAGIVPVTVPLAVGA